MKIKKITSCIILATSSLWLTGCHSGSGGTPNSTQSNSSSLTKENARQSTKSLNASIDEINTWWEVVQAEKKADAYQKEVNGSVWKTFMEKGDINFSLIGTKLGKVTGNLALNLLGQVVGFSSIDDVFNKFIIGKLFPSGPSQAEIFYQNIMNQLMTMDKKLDAMKIIGDETLQTIVSNQLNQGQRDIKSRYNTVDNDRSDLVTYLNSFTIGNSKLGTQFNKGEIDFIESAETQGKFHVNGELLKLTMFIFADEHKSFSSIAEQVFNEKRMTDLDTVVQELSALADHQLVDNDKKASLSNGFSSNGADTLLVPTVMKSISDYIVNKNQLAFLSPAPNDRKLDKDRIFINGQTNIFHKEYNRLSSHLEYAKFLNGLSIQLLTRLVDAQRFQYISILFRYLGGDKNIYIPNKINIALGTQEAKILKDESDAREMLKTDPDKAQEKFNAIADARKELFINAIDLLNSYYAQRGANVNTLISTPNSNYGKLVFDGYISNGSLRQAFLPTWDFLRGRGKFSESGSFPIHAIKSNSDDERDFGSPFYMMDGKPTSIRELVDGTLSMQPQFYWDGYYLKTTLLANSDSKTMYSNSSTMQRIGDMCNTNANGQYQLEQTYDGQLYCSVNSFKYDVLPLYDTFRTRNTAFIDIARFYDYIDLYINDNGATYRGNVIGSNGLEYYAQVKYDRDPDTYTYQARYCDWNGCSYGTIAKGVKTNAIQLDMDVLYANSKNSNIHKFYLPIGTPFGRIFLRIDNGDGDSFTSMTKYPYDVNWKPDSSQRTHEMAFNSGFDSSNNYIMMFVQNSTSHGARDGWARHVLFTPLSRKEYYDADGMAFY